MKIALISDIHANLPALEAVLNHSKQHGIQEIWNAGDSVGYNAFPDEVLDTLIKWNVLSIRGNYDNKVLKFKRKSEKWKSTKKPGKWLAFQWAYEHISKTNRKYLKSMPEEIRFEKKGWEILITHGSPESEEEPLQPTTPEERFEELSRMVEVDVIISGHSHQPLIKNVNKVCFINPGSVGRPDDGDPRASYAILSLEREKLSVEHLRIHYDVQKAVDAIRNNNLPGAFADMLHEGKSLDDII